MSGKNQPVAESTPVRNPNKRMRVSILQQDAQNDADNSMSPLRRRSKLHSVSIRADNEQEDHNDEVERSLRRKQAHLQETFSSSRGTPSPTTSVSEKDLKNHFEICVKLFTENKINSKNAWNLKIIDYMNAATKTSKDPLQLGSMGLDVSSKVYSIRVDDIHSDGLKLASSMARMDNAPNDAPDDNAGDENEEQNQSIRQGRKRKKRRRLSGQKITIAKDPNSLVGPVTKLESVFFQNRLSIESSVIENLCTNTLFIDKYGYKFVLLCTEKFWPSDSENDEIIKNSTKKNIEIPPVNAEKICVPFAHFDISSWDPEQEELLQEHQTTIDNGQMLDSISAPPILELDGSIHDDSDVAIEEGDDCEVHEPLMQQQRAITSDSTEYLYNNVTSLQCGKIIENMWAGPSHWKLKCINSAKSRFSGQQNRLAKRQSKKVKIIKNRIDMDSAFEPFDMNDIIKVRRRPKLIDISEITIPLGDPDIKKFQESIGESLLKPGFFVDRRRKNQVKELTLEPYNYENPGDNDYCSQNTNDAFDGNDAQLGFNENDEEETHEEFCSGQDNLIDNLVQAPEMVPQTYIPYALQPKKMDMKKLKTVMWSSLTKSKNPKDKAEVVTTAFADLYRELPSLLGEKMKENLSMPIVFVALLHLANEHNLELTSQDVNNFNISSTKKV